MREKSEDIGPLLKVSIIHTSALQVLIDGKNQKPWLIIDDCGDRKQFQKANWKFNPHGSFGEALGSREYLVNVQLVQGVLRLEPSCGKIRVYNRKIIWLIIYDYH